MEPAQLRPAISVTHQHLLSVLYSELQDRTAGGKVRILDAGCGNGRLLSYLNSNLPLLLPGVEFELHGFDVNDHGVQAEGYFAHTIAQLTAEHPGIDWKQRLHVIPSAEAWPYEAGYFDVVISNQVLEHVHAPHIFFAETYRVLRRGAFSVHLFPLRHYIYEGHLLLPWVHRILDHDLLVAYIRALSWFGLGKYREHHKATGVTRTDFSRAHADYMAFFTSYLSKREILQICRRAGLRASFRYTDRLYSSKLRQVLRMRPKFQYHRPSSAWMQWIKVMLLRYVGGVTLFLEKDEVYTGSQARSVH